MKSGYHIINAKGLDLNDLGKVDGLNTACKVALAVGKPTFLENVVNDDETVIPIPVSLMMASTSVNIYAPTGNLSVSSSDVVSALADDTRTEVTKVTKKK